jgi:hypothetical protein
MNFSMNISAVYGYKNMVKIYYTLEPYTHLGAIKKTYSTLPMTISIRPNLSGNHRSSCIRNKIKNQQVTLLNMRSKENKKNVQYNMMQVCVGMVRPPDTMVRQLSGVRRRAAAIWSGGCVTVGRRGGGREGRGEGRRPRRGLLFVAASLHLLGSIHGPDLGLP